MVKYFFKDKYKKIRFFFQRADFWILERLLALSKKSLRFCRLRFLRAGLSFFAG